MPTPEEIRKVIDRDLENGRKNIPISRIFNATLPGEMLQGISVMKRLEHAPDVLWWKYSLEGDRFYIYGQRRSA